MPCNHRFHSETTVPANILMPNLDIARLQIVSRAICSSQTLPVAFLSPFPNPISQFPFGVNKRIDSFLGAFVNERSVAIKSIIVERKELYLEISFE